MGFCCAQFLRKRGVTWIHEFMIPWPERPLHSDRIGWLKKTIKHITAIVSTPFRLREPLNEAIKERKSIGVESQAAVHSERSEVHVFDVPTRSAWIAAITNTYHELLFILAGACGILNAECAIEEWMHNNQMTHYSCQRFRAHKSGHKNLFSTSFSHRARNLKRIRRWCLNATSDGNAHRIQPHEQMDYCARLSVVCPWIGE